MVMDGLSFHKLPKLHCLDLSSMPPDGLKIEEKYDSKIILLDVADIDISSSMIRERIEKDTSNPQILITKRGVGYYIPSK